MSGRVAGVCRYTCSRELSLNVSRQTHANAVARATLMLRRNEQHSRMLRLSLAAAGVACALHASQCVRACVRALFGSAGSFLSPAKRLFPGPDGGGDRGDAPNQLAALGRPHANMPVLEVARGAQGPSEEGAGVVEAEHVVVVLDIVLIEKLVHVIHLLPRARFEQENVTISMFAIGFCIRPPFNQTAVLARRYYATRKRAATNTLGSRIYLLV